jgi:hypothetical protein
MNFFGSVTVVMVIGALIGHGSFMYTYNDILSEARANQDLIKQCEAELPRNQACELVAVPVEIEE